MRWNGTDITGIPTFIYHHELIAGLPDEDLLPDPDGPGVLSCSATFGTISWNFVDRMINPEQLIGNFKLRLGRARSQVLQNANHRLEVGKRTEAFLNGLWSCEQGGTRLYVGVYARSSSE